MKKILFLMTLIPIVFIGSSCNSGGGDGSGSDHDSGHDTTACSTDIIGKWSGVTLDIDYGFGCSDQDVNNYDISEVVFDFNSDDSYEIQGNGNYYQDDEVGSWACDGDEIDICETGDDCAAWDYEINGDQATVDITIDSGGCTYNISISLEQK